jgi:hypothetical protein
MARIRIEDERRKLATERVFSNSEEIKQLQAKIAAAY